MTYKLENKQSPNYTPHGKVENTFGTPREVIGLTIHHWGMDGQSHDGVARYLSRTNGTSSAHVVLSAGRVTRLVNDSDAAWHAGNAEGNASTVGVECRPEMSDGDWATLVQWCTDMEEVHGSLKYFRHKDWKATACPGRYSGNIGQLVEDVNAEHERRGNFENDEAVRTLKYGVSGGDVLRFKEDMNRVFPSYAGIKETTFFGRYSEAVVKEFQERTGLVDDGIVGPNTRAELGKHGVSF